MSTIATNSVITYSTTNGIMINGNSVSAWPINISANVTVTFGSILVITSSSQYFNMYGSGVTVDGSFNNVIVKDVVGFSGLCNNIGGYNNITIQNFCVISTGTTTLSGGGWVCRSSFGGTNNYVKNCYSTGAIVGVNSGGICGSSCAIHCVNCYSTGDINSTGSGGIYSNNCTGNATNCYSTGNITAVWCGGIYSYQGSGNATNCYSTGNITAVASGGIYAWGSTGNATNCHSSGNITASSCGGIYSYSCSGTATNCYFTGNVSGGDSNGGICSYGCSTNINNCYSTGTISGGSGDMVGYSYTGTITNSYSKTNYYP